MTSMIGPLVSGRGLTSTVADEYVEMMAASRGAVTLALGHIQTLWLRSVKRQPVAECLPTPGARLCLHTGPMAFGNADLIATALRLIRYLIARRAAALRPAEMTSSTWSRVSRVPPKRVVSARPSARRRSRPLLSKTSGC